ncbi:MAG: hypothetical protein GX998_05425 [Firmicutes bacterium]|nr:hypothetical protein [Bacillota bacterium]
MVRVTTGRKVVLMDERGHAMVFLLLTLGAILAFAVGIYLTSQIAVGKIKAQNAADAAAMAGAGMMADSLDLIVYVNWIRISSHLIPHWGREARRTAEMLAREVIKDAAAIVNGRAIQVGLANEALVLPIHNPDLGVTERRIRLFGRVGYYKDRLKGRIGNRFVRVVAATKIELPEWVRALVRDRTAPDLAFCPTASAEAVVHGKGLALPKFGGGLGKLR